MAAWQLFLASILGVLAGTAGGVFCYYAYLRLVDRNPVSLQAVFRVLFTAKPKPDSPGRTTPVYDYDTNVDIPMAPATGPHAAAFRSFGVHPARDLSKAEVLGLLLEYDHDLKIPTRPSRDTTPSVKTNVGNGTRWAVHHLHSDSRRYPETARRNDRTSPLRAECEQSEASCPVQDTSGETVLPLLWELERNRKAVRGFSGDNLVPLRSDAWDRNQAVVRSLPGDLRNGLESVYVDIGLLNQIAWLSSEFNRHSPSLREHYLDLGTNIADRLDQLVKAMLSRFAQEEAVIRTLA